MSANGETFPHGRSQAQKLGNFFFCCRSSISPRTSNISQNQPESCDQRPTVAIQICAEMACNRIQIKQLAYQPHPTSGMTFDLRKPVKPTINPHVNRGEMANEAHLCADKHGNWKRRLDAKWDRRRAVFTHYSS
jgi:hypothetical protein